MLQIRYTLPKLAVVTADKAWSRRLRGGTCCLYILVGTCYVCRRDCLGSQEHLCSNRDDGVEVNMLGARPLRYLYETFAPVAVDKIWNFAEGLLR